jgi:hypothetical protein
MQVGSWSECTPTTSCRCVLPVDDGVACTAH